jgi:16S rRNA (uracil1498-N3)-methyltransferase
MHIFLISPPGDEKTVRLEEEENHHATKVLRCKTGDLVVLLDGAGKLYQAKFKSLSPKNSELDVLDIVHVPKLPYQLHMAVAPTKMMERFEWFLEKATEIGLSEITPIITERTERSVVKMSRMQKVIQAAVKQSKQAYFPIINEAVSFKEFIKTQSTTHKFIAHCLDIPKNHLIKSVNPNSDNLILIGPEGDFTSQEIEFALESGYLAVSLGESRLRAETAAVVACSQMNSALIINQ